MDLHIISFTKNGFALSKRLEKFEDGKFVKSVSCAAKNFENRVILSDWVKDHFKNGNCLIFIGASGIAVRAISPFVKDKKTDPAVLVIDEKASFVIPLLSGHIGGANEIAKKIAFFLSAIPVITTASDVNNLPAIDEFAKKNSLSINNMNFAKEFTAKLLDFYESSEKNEKPVSNENLPKFTISPFIRNDILNLIPKSVILGIGCRKGKSPEELETFVLEVLKENKIEIQAVKEIASIDIKKDEKALTALSEKLSVPFITFSADELNKISQKVSHSDFVKETIGTDNVCERSVFAAGSEKLIVPKTLKSGMTVACGLIKENDFFLR